MNEKNPTSRLSAALKSMKTGSALNEPTSTSKSTTNTKSIDGRTLTNEQIAVLESSARKIKVQAYAGTGKTTLLRAFANQSSAAKGLYLAFNNSIAAQGRALFPDSVQSRTHNATALRELGRLHPGWRSISSAKLDTPQAAHIEAICRKTKTASQQVLAAIQNYIYSTSPDIQEIHVLGSTMACQTTGTPNIDAWAHTSAARLVWDLMCDPHSNVPMPHDGCLKLWSLAPKKLPYDYLLIDESQDSNPAFLQAIEAQDCRLIYVGDEHQGIYGFRGAINALSSVTECEERHLTETHRFGPLLSMLANEVIKSKGQPSLLRSAQSCHNTDVVIGRAPFGSNPLYLARTNAGLFEQALSFAKQGKPFALVGDAKKLHFPDISDLMDLHAGKGAGGYAHYRDLDALLLAAETANQNSLSMRTRLAMKYGQELPAMLEAINKRMTTPAAASQDTAKLSTLHQAKGLESDWVELLDDFVFTPSKQTEASGLHEEANVLYVALTRARRGLAIRSEEVAKWAEPFLHASRIRPTETQDEDLFG